MDPVPLSENKWRFLVFQMLEMLGDPNYQNDDDTEEFPNLFVSLALLCSVFNACVVTLSFMKAMVWVSNKQSVEFPKLILKLYCRNINLLKTQTTLFFYRVAEHKMMNPSEEPITVSNMTEREKEVCVFWSHRFF